MKHLLLALVMSSFCLAQENPPAAASTEKAKQELLDTIFSSLSNQEFEKAIAKAIETNVHPQVILEARFLHLVDQGNNQALAKFSAELLPWREKFDPDASEIFGVKEDWLSVVHYTQALAALENNQQAEFKKHITEAFWLSPKHAQIYAPPIERLRLQKAMAKVTLKPDFVLQPQDGSKPITLGSLMKHKKALLLHFWSPMSQEVQINMPDFAATSAECQEHGIAVASVLIGHRPEIKKDADEIRKEVQDTAKCAWIAGSNKNSLATQLRIVDVPTMVLVSPDGKILFNGHPSQETFWQELKKLAPELHRPNNTEHKHADD
ncbi:hypothetical protein JIN77_06610 [Verrucomicrobiaceae bacterium R5-34]|nr:hypothetical protein [Verrucomicrobiaceae bacterium R5-34]